MKFKEGRKKNENKRGIYYLYYCYLEKLTMEQNLHCPIYCTNIEH